MRVVPWLALVTLVVAVPSKPCHGMDGLAEWLCSSAVTLPDITIKESIFTLSVSALTCTQLQIGSLASDMDLHGNTLTVSVQGLHVSCSAPNAGIDQPIPFHSALDIGINGASFKTTVKLVFDHDGLAVGATLRGTSFDTGAISINFHSILPVSWLLGAVEKALKGYIESTVVATVESFVDQNVSAALSLLANDSRPYLAPPKVWPEPPLPADAINWRANEGLHAANFVLDEAIGPDGPLGINGAIRLLTEGSGSIGTNQSRWPSWLPLPTVNLPGFNMSVNEAFARGLDSVGKVALLRPSAHSDHSLDNWLELGTLDIGLNLSATVVPYGPMVHSAPYTQAFTLHVGLRELGVKSTLTAGVDSSLSLLMALNDTTCLARAVLGVGLRMLGLRLTIHSVQVGGSFAPSSLESMLAAFADHATRLLTNAFEPVVPKLADGIAGGPLRSLLNATLVRLIDHVVPPGQLPCAAPPPSPPPPPPPPYLPGMMDWRTNTPLRMLDLVLDDVIGADGPLGLNEIARRLTHGTGRFSLQPTWPILKPKRVPGAGNVSVDLTCINMSGLDQVSSFRLL